MFLVYQHRALFRKTLMGHFFLICLALASGKPVIALGRGGALETVPTADPLGGILFEAASDNALREAMERWERRETEIQPQALKAYAQRFSERAFAEKMRAILFPDAAAEVSNL